MTRLTALARRDAGSRFVLLLFIVAVLWACTAVWIVPALIRSAYAGESLPVLNRLIEGQNVRSVDDYLAFWTLLAWVATAALVVVAAVFTLVVAWRRRPIAGDGAAPRTVGARDVLFFAIWTGIVAGLAEAANGIFRHRLQHLPTGEVVSGELVWMAPLAAALTLVALALVLVAAHRLAAGRVDIHRLAPSIFAGVAVYSLLRAMSVGIAGYAAAILALGVATVVLRMVAADPEFVFRGVRRTTPPMLIALGLWAVAVPLQRRQAERRAVAGLPAAASDAPNVLVIVWDCVRSLDLSLYGYDRETTPELERLAQRGAVFERAFATSPWSLPSHGSIFTGRYPPEMTVGFNSPLDRTHPTLAEQLQRRGYVTGGFSANLFYLSPDYGLARGFTWYDSRPAFNVLVLAHTWWLTRTAFFEARTAIGNHKFMLKRPASHVNASLLRWVSRRGDRPFFAFINLFDAHEPYAPPAPFDRSFSARPTRYWFTDEDRGHSPETLGELRTSYDGSIRYIDHELGQVLESLREMRALDNTIIIVTADHGEEFGEHGSDLVGHAFSLYSPVLLVPMVVVYPPRIQGGIRRREVVSIRDIPATVMDAAGLADSSPFPGTSLLRHASGSLAPEELGRPRLSATQKHRFAEAWPSRPASIGQMFSLQGGDLHYIVDAKGAEQLFDLSTDIWERNDRVRAPEMLEPLERFRATLDSVVGPKGSRAASAAPAGGGRR